MGRYTLTSTIGSPLGEVQLMGAELKSTASGTDLELARIVFVVHGDGATEVKGIIVETQTKGKVGKANRQIVAGHGFIVITKKGRKLSLARDSFSHRSITSKHMATNMDSTWARHPGRRLKDGSTAPSCQGGNLRGDINA